MQVLMAATIGLSLLCAALAGEFVNTPEWDDESGDVVFMDDAHFSDYKKENPKFLAFFYAPWCGHCKNAKPHYGKASSEVDTPLVAMDCTGSGKATCDEFGVKGFPTIKWFDGDADPEDFSGARDEAGFKNFVNGKDPDYEAPPVGPFTNTPEWGDDSGEVVFMDDAHFSEFRAETPQFLAFFYAPWCGHCKNAKPHYGKASTQIGVKMLAMDCTGSGKATCGEFDVESFPTIKWFEDDGEPTAYEGGREEKGFLNFLKKKDPSYVPPPFQNSAPEGWEESGKVVHMVDDHFEAYRAKHPRFLAFFYAPWCGHCKNAKPDFAAASSKFRRSMPFVAMDCTSESQTCKTFGVTGYPTMKYFDGPGEPVDYTGDRSSGDFISFVEGKLDELAKAGGGEVDLSKLRVKQLKKMLKARGVECRGCTEKKHLVDRVKETMHVKKVEPKKHGKTLMQEKREAKLKELAKTGWAGELYGNGAVIHSYDGHFEELLTGEVGKVGFLAFFYAPWCGHCKTAKPDIVWTSDKLAEANAPHKIVVVDAEASPGLAQKYGVTGFPTYSYFEGGVEVKSKYTDAGAPRGKKGWLKFLMQQSEPDWAPEPVGPFVNELRWDDKNGKVVFMDDEHFKDFAKETPRFLAFFYAPWCGHCKNAKPHYADASEETEYPMLAMDCTSFGSETCGAHGVNSYPTIKWFENGEPEDYSGARDKAGFVDFVNERGNPDFVKPPPGPFTNTPEWGDDSGEVVFMDDAHFSEFRADNPQFLAFFYAPWCGHCKNAKPHYGKASEGANAPLVAMDCTGPGKATCGDFDVKGFPTIKWFDGEGEPTTYSGGRTESGFSSFVEDHATAADDEGSDDAADKEDIITKDEL